MKIQTITVFYTVSLLFGFIPFSIDDNVFTNGFITISANSIDFGEVNKGENAEYEFTIYNGSDSDLIIQQTILEEIAFSISAEESVIDAGASLNFFISFSPVQNIYYFDFLLFETDLCDQTIFVELSGSGVLDNPYYSSTHNLWTEDLEAELSQIISSHTNIGYTNARIALFGDLANQDDEVQCVYTEEWVSILAGDVPDWNTMNTEHSWPQSEGADTEPMKSDIHHLVPTMNSANSARGALSFGNVVSGVDWNLGGSERGYDENGIQVFEPRDAHKGDAARVLFYYALKYGNVSGFLTYQEEVLRNWFWEDPVNEWEIARNEGIYDYQDNRNPFIDYPEFLDRILSISDTLDFPIVAEIIVSPTEVYFDTSGKTFYLFVANKGSVNLTISGSVNDPNFEVYVSDTINPNESVLVPILFNPEGIDACTGILTIQSNDSDEEEISVVLLGFGGNMLLPGDCNTDGQVNVLDVVILVNVALGGDEPNNFSFSNADMNGDGMLNVLDIVQTVNEALNQ